MTSLVRVMLILSAALLALLTMRVLLFLLKRGSCGSAGRSAAARAGKSGSDPLPHPALALRAADRAGDELMRRRPPMPSWRTVLRRESHAAPAPVYPRSLELSPGDGLTFDIFEGDWRVGISTSNVLSESL
jgi:hypothetical protein